MGMTLDLSGRITFSKISEEKDSNAFEIPEAIVPNEEMDNQFWTDISSQICYIGQPTKVSDETGSLRITLDSDSFRKVVAEINQGESNTDTGTLAKDLTIIRKLQFLAHNFE